MNIKQLLTYSWLPSLYNAYQPYLLRWPALATVAAGLALIQVVTTLVPLIPTASAVPLYGPLSTPEVGIAVVPTASSSALTGFAHLPLTTQIAAVCAAGLSSLYLLQHLVIRKRRLLWDEHLHPRPILQGLVLLVVAWLIIATGSGELAG